MFNKFRSLVFFASIFFVSVLFLSTAENSFSQPTSWCCNNNEAMGGEGQCVQAPNGIQNCQGEALTFIPGPPDGPAVPLPPEDCTIGPPGTMCPQTGDLCPGPSPERQTCMCDDGNGGVIPCQDLPPPPTGCCVIAQEDCVPDQTQEECTMQNGIIFNPNDPSCQATPECFPPPDEPGCCVISQGMCEMNVLPQDCNNQFVPDNPLCTNIPECEPPTGCCVLGPNDCINDVPEQECNGENWVIGEDCDELVGICGDPLGCCQETAMCSITTEIDCPSQVWTEAAPCIDVTCGEPIGCCEGIVAPQEDSCQSPLTESQCLTLQGQFSPGLDCNIEDTCGTLPEPGCCQEDTNMCSEVLFENCNGEFFDSSSCVDGDTRCNAIPTGCCQEDLELCSPQTTFAQCEGDWFEGSQCLDGNTRCSNIPLGCCVITNEESRVRFTCEETIQGVCEEDGGLFIIDAICNEVQECNEGPIVNIPTLSQWGLIVMAGLIGLMSLFILIKRKEIRV